MVPCLINNQFTVSTVLGINLYSMMVKYFTSLCDDRKESCDLCYSAVKNSIYRYLIQNWEVIENFEGTYADDYCSLQDNSEASVSKYSVSVFRGDDQWHGEREERFEREPLPDLLTFSHT